MLEIGNIVTPKGYNCNILFKIIDKKDTPFENGPIYYLQRITQFLDSIYGPIKDQLDFIFYVENTYFKEDDLKLITKNAIKFDKLLNFKEGENKMDILDLYEIRKVKALEKEILEAKSKVKEQDEIQSIILEMTNQVNTILENQGRKIKYEFEPNLITLETEAKLDELEKEHHKQIEELRSTLEEIRALFELTDDYNERIKILKRYDIINKNGKLNI